MQVKDIMSAPVHTIAPSTTVAQIASLLLIRRISGVPVVDDGRLVGIVSESDLLHRHEIGTDDSTPIRWWMRFLQQERLPAEYVKSHGGHASDIMTEEVITVGEDAPLARVARLLEAHRIRRIPVMRGKTVAGIVTCSDLLRALLASSGTTQAQVQSDQAILERLMRELDRQPWWRPEWSTVTVKRGVVHYQGMVDNDMQRRAARVAAENIPGVSRVVDDRLCSAEWPAMLCG